MKTKDLHKAIFGRGSNKGKRDEGDDAYEKLSLQDKIKAEEWLKSITDDDIDKLVVAFIKHREEEIKRVLEQNH